MQNERNLACVMNVQKTKSTTTTTTKCSLDALDLCALFGIWRSKVVPKIVSISSRRRRSHFAEEVALLLNLCSVQRSQSEIALFILLFQASTSFSMCATSMDARASQTDRHTLREHATVSRAVVGWIGWVMELMGFHIVVVHPFNF